MSKLTWKKEIDENGYATYSMNLFPFDGPSIREWHPSHDGGFHHLLKIDRTEKDRTVFVFRCEQFSSIDEAMEYAEQKLLEVFKPIVESMTQE